MLCCVIDNLHAILMSSYVFIYSSWLPLLVATGVIGGAWHLLKIQSEKQKLKAKRDKKRKECANSLVQLEEKIKNNQLVSHDKMNIIISYDLNTLLKFLKNGDLKPTEVLQAYQIKALQIHRQTNCLVASIPEAEEWAKILESSKERGCLYGLPVSLKECYSLKGRDSTIGCACYINDMCESDAVLIQVLKKHGAVPFVRTNVPQALFSWETSNPIFGHTVNFLDNARGVGGSSGGEACLIAGGGSIIGLGTDDGGSIRIPCCLCGIYGFKPTSSRLSPVGNYPLPDGQNLINSSCGPMGRDVTSLTIILRALIGPIMFDLDSTIPKIPFNEEVFAGKGRLRIGYYTEDDYLSPAPAMKEGVLLAVKALEEAGHELIPWRHEGFGNKSIELMAAAAFGDQGQALLNILRNDEIDKIAMGSNIFLISLPRWLKWLLQPIVHLVEPRMIGLFRRMLSMRTISDWWRLSTEFQEFRRDVIKQWKNARLDVVICPGFACPALPFGSAELVSGAVSYVTLYNVLDFPVGTMPVKKVTQSDVDAMKDYKVNGIWEKVIKQGMNGSVGLPVNIQVVALPWQEELCLRVMTELETVLKASSKTFNL